MPAEVSEMIQHRTMLKDSDWSVLDGDACRVIGFTPMAEIRNGKVHAISKSMPYAAVTFECTRIPDVVEGFICHKLDFKHLWAALRERPLGENEEALFFWNKSHLKSYAKLFSRIMPRLCVMVCPKGAFELMTDKMHRPELGGEARWEATRPIVQWKPEVMD